MAAVVLAAGLSRRMGRPKPLVSFQGKPLLRHTLDRVLAAGVDPVVAVLGSRYEETRKVVPDGVEIVFNPDFEAGMSTSLKAGIRAVESRCQAALVVLGDQPLVSPSLIGEIISLYRASRRPIVQPVYAGQPGNPVLFDRALFDEIMEIEGDMGARDVVRRHGEEVARLVVADVEMAYDVDTPEDLARLVRLIEAE